MPVQLGSQRAMATIIALFLLLTASSAYQEVVNFGSVADLSKESLELDTGHFIGPGIQDINSLDGDNAKFTHMNQKRYGSGEPYWVSQIKRQGKSLYNGNATYQLWRNVKDYGAKGDGVTDDSYAINNATADGARCGLGCDSATTLGAILYFPPGTYILSTPIYLYYNTLVHGDANDLPVIKATADFNEIGLFDADRYIPGGGGATWFTNQNNMWRQIRNFVIDLTLVPPTRSVGGIHWQVAQATSLQNIVFNMAQGTPGDGNQQKGIFMDNGSGGHLEDLIFNGGGYGFFAGNQQFTCRNLTFNNCNTAIFQNWSWVFLWKSIFINNCGVAFDVSQGDANPAVGSVIMQDSVITDTQYGVVTSFGNGTIPKTAGTIILDNVNFVRTDPAVVRFNNGTFGDVLVPGNPAGSVVVDSFVQGRTYTAFDAAYAGQQGKTCYGPTANSARVQQLTGKPPKSQSLLNADGTFVEKSRPQYEGVPVGNFKSAFDFGCHGDGVQDDTACVQNFLNSIDNAAGQIAYFDHGSYLIRDTINIPINIKIIGEMWPMLMVDGTTGAFQDVQNPQVAFRVGQPGDVGDVEIVEILFETRGPVPGAVLMEWNLRGSAPGTAGMWDTHFRLGGTNGTELQSDNCAKNPNLPHGANTACYVAFLILHITNSAANVILSNNWGWVSDHEMDRLDHNQIDIYNGRGLLVESQGPIWIYGSSMEHSMLYNYQIANAKEIYMGVIQSETAYMQNNPDALSTFQLDDRYSDPTFDTCFLPICTKTWGLRIFNSTYIFTYGAGMYSFFQNYDSGCLTTHNCQQKIVSIEQSEAIYLYALNTVGAQDNVDVDNVAIAAAVDNPNNFADTVALFEYP